MTGSAINKLAKLQEQLGGGMNCSSLMKTCMFALSVMSTLVSIRFLFINFHIICCPSILLPFSKGILNTCNLLPKLTMNSCVTNFCAFCVGILIHKEMIIPVNLIKTRILSKFWQEDKQIENDFHKNQSLVYEHISIIPAQHAIHYNKAHWKTIAYAALPWIL